MPYFYGSNALLRNHGRSRVLPLQTDLFKYVSLAGAGGRLDLHHIILIQVHVCPVCVQEGLTTLHQHTHARVCVFSSKPQSVDRVNIIICSLSSHDNGVGVKNEGDDEGTGVVIH